MYNCVGKRQTDGGEREGRKEKGISLSRAIVKLSSCSGALSRLRNSARAFHWSTVNNLSDYTDHD